MLLFVYNSLNVWKYSLQIRFRYTLVIFRLLVFYSKAETC